MNDLVNKKESFNNNNNILKDLKTIENNNSNYNSIYNNIHINGNNSNNNGNNNNNNS